MNESHSADRSTWADKVSDVSVPANIVWPKREPAPTGAWLVFSAALILTVVEGGIRKWAIGSESGPKSYLVYFSKDILFTALLLFPRGSSRSVFARQFQGWLIPGCALVITGAIISALGGGSNSVGSLLTLRALVLLPVFAWLAIDRLRGLPLPCVAALLSALTLLNYALSVTQNRLPADHILNRYVVADADIVAEQSGVRATGTFSYITGLSLMSSVGVWAGMVLLVSSEKKSVRSLGVLSLVAGVGCALSSISRAPVVVAAVLVLGCLVVSHSVRSMLWRNALFVALLTSLLLIGSVGSDLKALWAGLQARHDAASDSFSERAFGQFGELGEAVRLAPLGKGVGTEQIGGTYAASGVLAFTTYESQFPRIVMEVGFIGFAGFLLVCGGALIVLQRARGLASSSGEKNAILATQLLLLAFFYTNVVFNHTASAFSWMLFAATLAAVPCRSSVLGSFTHASRTKTRRCSRRSRLAAGRGHDRRSAAQSAAP